MSTTAALLHWDGLSAATSYMSEDLIPANGEQSFDTIEVEPPIADARLSRAAPTLDTAGLCAPLLLSTLSTCLVAG